MIEIKRGAVGEDAPLGENDPAGGEITSKPTQALPQSQAARPGGRALAREAKRISRPEQALHIALVEHLQWRGVQTLFWFHPANGGRRSPIEAAIFTSLGATPGIPDLILVLGGRCYGLELKTEGGRASNNQRVTIAAMERAGCLCAVCYGIDQALAQLKAWGMLR